MKTEEAKKILLLYRPGTRDAEDPQIAAALEVARKDLELSSWLDQHIERQQQLRQCFRSLPIPPGLKEQIISEGVTRKAEPRSDLKKVLALVTVILVFGVIAVSQLWHRSPKDDPLKLFRNHLTSMALHGYGMDLLTNSPVAIRDFLAEKQCPADYVVPSRLEPVAVVGCAVEVWQNEKVSMICFRTGKPRPLGQESDLWLFVAKRTSVGNAPQPGEQKILSDGQAVSIVWTKGDAVYMLATPGEDAAELRKYL